MTGLRGSLRAPHSFYCSCQSSEIPSGPLALSVMLFLSQYTALSVVMLITTSNRPTNDCSLTGALDRFYSRLSAPTTDCLFIVCLPLRPVKKMGYRASLGTLALLLIPPLLVQLPNYRYVHIFLSLLSRLRAEECPPALIRVAASPLLPAGFRKHGLLFTIESSAI